MQRNGGKMSCISSPKKIDETTNFYIQYCSYFRVFVFPSLFISIRGSSTEFSDAYSVIQTKNIPVGRKQKQN